MASGTDVFMEDTESEDYFRQIAGCAVGAAGVFDPLGHASLPSEDVTMLTGSTGLARPVRGFCGFGRTVQFVRPLLLFVASTRNKKLFRREGM